ncbi:hypothetical protein U9M48_008051 [Paspalum notatum var. saurae]|uniref:Uncharacterized protein n=1 Tax=Paspalum notatum var. saurae TaxID=547442 RepID=A0AAQ3SN79_PASNO
MASPSSGDHSRLRVAASGRISSPLPRIWWLLPGRALLVLQRVDLGGIRAGLPDASSGHGRRQGGRGGAAALLYVARWSRRGQHATGGARVGHCVAGGGAAERQSCAVVAVWLWSNSSAARGAACAVPDLAEAWLAATGWWLRQLASRLLHSRRSDCLQRTSATCPTWQLRVR